MVAEAVDQQSAATTEIARSIEQAATGTAEVSSNIGEVSDAARHAGSTASEVLAAAAELTGQADALRTEVEHFLEAIHGGKKAAHLQLIAAE